MGIENRDYFRGSRGGGTWDASGSLPPTIKFLLIANGIVFLLQIFVTRPATPVEPKLNDQLIQQSVQYRKDEHDVLMRRWVQRQKEKQEAGDLTVDDESDPMPVLPSDEVLEAEARDQFRDIDLPEFGVSPRESVIEELFELDVSKTMKGQVWRLITCEFCHSRFSLLHIVFNMLALWWFGRSLESIYGPREFLLFYLAAAVTASLAFVALDLYTGEGIPSIGASGAVMGVLMLFCMHYPRYTIRIYWLIPIEIRWAVLLYILFDLHPVLLTLAGTPMSTGIAHSAHLGGLAFGYLYFRYRWKLEPIYENAAGMFSSTRRSLKIRRQGLKIHAPVEESSVEPEGDSELDAVLRKINESGRENLTDAEEEILREASRRMKQR